MSTIESTLRLLVGRPLRLELLRNSWKLAAGKAAQGAHLFYLYDNEERSTPNSYPLIHRLDTR